MSSTTVLHSVKPPNDRTNPFVALHVDNLPHDIRSHWFTWRESLFGRYDIIHFQWPENLLRASGPAKRLAKQLAFAWLLTRLRLTKTPIVVTVHNLTPHEQVSKPEGRLLRSLYRHATALIALNDVEALDELSAAPVTVVLHGDYRQVHTRRADHEVQPGRIVYFGSIRSYKNVPALIHATRDCVNETTLVILGRAWTEELEQRIRDAATGRDDVRLRLEELPSAHLAAEISRAELVVLPYTSLYNSGAVLLALTIGVPVLVPATPSTRALREEVGTNWLLLYEGELCARHIDDALTLIRARVTAQGADAPDLSHRDWHALGEAYAAVYRKLASDSHRG